MAGDWFKAGDLLCFDMKTGESHGLNADDDRFIAAANPAAALSLLNECESLHSALGSPDEITAEPAGDYDALRKQFISLLMLANSKAKQAQYWRSQSDHAMHQTLVQTAANVNAERDTNAMLTDALMKAEAERDAALAERDEHREMSGCMDLLRRDLIEAGVIGDACPPLFMTEAILGYFGQLRAELEACRKDARRWWCVRNAVQLQSPYAVWREGSHPVLGKDADELVDNFLAQVKEAPNA